MALPSSRTARWLAPVLVGAWLAVAARPAWAHGDMGLGAALEAFSLVVGAVLLWLSLFLGTRAWTKVLQPQTSVGGIFRRGILGVAAVLAFATGGVLLCLGATLFGDSAETVLLAWVVLSMVLLAVEFFVGATLYRRADLPRRSGFAAVLSVVSYVIGGVLMLVALLTAAFAIDKETGPERPSNEVRGYLEGCASDDASDCNMLGLRYKSGATGLPRDLEKAAESFDKACGLGLEIACSNRDRLRTE